MVEGKANHADATARLVKSAQQMGIELDRDEAELWSAAMSAESQGSVAGDFDSGVNGHQVTLADDAAALVRLRRLASIVAFADRPPELQTALAQSGSVAQDRIHRIPTDADFFERIHIRAETKEEACRILAEAVREKAVATLRGPGYRLQRVTFGSWPVDATVDGASVRSGQPVSWGPAEVEAGAVRYRLADGRREELRWADAARDPGWCKLDWLVSDPTSKGLTSVSNMLDPTWEGPDGTIAPLDGFLEPYFMEVYLETESIPLYSRLVKKLGADTVAEYVELLTEEVYRYTVKEPNYDKAARRMYNIFRLTGRYPEAAYIRELFDEPVTSLYQVAVLLRTLDEAADAGDAFERDALVAQVDKLIMSAIAALDGQAESDMVRRLLRLRDSVSTRGRAGDRGADIAGVGDDALSAVNDYFERALTTVPTIARYLDSVASTQAEAVER